MRIKYVGPSSSGVELDGVTVLPGVSVEVDDDLAKGLLEQDVWEAAKVAPKKGDAS